MIHKIYRVEPSGRDKVPDLKTRRNRFVIGSWYTKGVVLVVLFGTQYLKLHPSAILLVTHNRYFQKYTNDRVFTLLCFVGASNTTTRILLANDATKTLY